jgi:hypothetical protein
LSLGRVVARFSNFLPRPPSPPLIPLSTATLWLSAPAPGHDSTAPPFLLPWWRGVARGVCCWPLLRSGAPSSFGRMPCARLDSPSYHPMVERRSISPLQPSIISPLSFFRPACGALWWRGAACASVPRTCHLARFQLVLAALSTHISGSLQLWLSTLPAPDQHPAPAMHALPWWRRRGVLLASPAFRLLHIIIRASVPPPCRSRSGSLQLWLSTLPAPDQHPAPAMHALPWWRRRGVLLASPAFRLLHIIIRASVPPPCRPPRRQSKSGASTLTHASTEYSAMLLLPSALLASSPSAPCWLVPPPWRRVLACVLLRCCFAIRCIHPLQLSTQASGVTAIPIHATYTRHMALQ